MPEPAATGSSPEDRIVEDESVRLALGRLSGKLRAVVVLRYYHGLSYAEIAETLEVPLGTVQSRLNEALKVLRRELGEERMATGPAREERRA